MIDNALTSIDLIQSPKGIEKLEEVIEIPVTRYIDPSFVDGEFSVTVQGPVANVRIQSIDGDSTIAVPIRHLERICMLLVHIRDDQAAQVTP